MAIYDIIVIGCSMGGLAALEELLSELSFDLSVPIVVVQHISPDSENYMVTLLNEHCALQVQEVDEKERLRPGVVYIAPPNFHVLLEKDKSCTLSVDEKVNFSRPSIDVLFETAAYCCGNKAVGIVLTGGNKDGAEGLKKIKKAGGLTIVQDPGEAEVCIMPEMAITIANPDFVLTLKQIAVMLNHLNT
jgi:two-component system chemotaxis response regulator CheB